MGTLALQQLVYGYLSGWNMCEFEEGPNGISPKDDLVSMLTLIDLACERAPNMAIKNLAYRIAQRSRPPATAAH